MCTTTSKQQSATLRRAAAAFFATATFLAAAHVAIGGISDATIVAVQNYRDAHFDYFVAGDPRLPRAAHTDFAVVLMGGGGIVDAAYRAIAAHAGGGHIVILRAVADGSFDPTDGDLGKRYRADWAPAASAETIVFHDREASFDPRVIAALKNADGIFLAGGDQGNYIRYWKGTPVQELLNAHVRAQRPIGGSSAGLAILGRFSYTCLDSISMESKLALADPYNAGITLDSDFLHFKGLEHVLTDTHFSARSRLGRLIAYLARLNKDRPSAHIVGIGVDEQTAVILDEHGVGRIADGSKGSAWLVELRRPASVLQPDRPLTIGDVRVSQVDAHGSIDLRNGRAWHPAAQTVLSIKAGVAAADPLTSAMMLRNAVPPNED